MKTNVLIFILSIATIFVSCKKKDHIKSIDAKLYIVNASPNAGTISVLQNLKSIGDFSFLTGMNAGTAKYLTVDSGFQNYKIRKGTTDYTTFLYANQDKYVTLCVFDTLVNNKVKTCFLNDEVDSAGMGNRSKVRVVQVSPDADTLLLITPALKDNKDSAFNGAPYFGNYSATEIYSRASFELFYTGVRSVKVYSTATKSYIRSYLFDFEKGGIYSFIFKGYVKRGGADSLSLSVIKHN